MSCRGGGRHSGIFYDVVSPENLFRAWRKFSKGKRANSEVVKFELNLEEEIFSLHERLKNKTWTNDPYVRRRISDPKPRTIHVASVQDRILFQAVYQKLYQIFDQTFIDDSYASRLGKGTHAGVNRFEVFARKVSANYTKSTLVLKCDIRKFFDTIDHTLLFSLLSKRTIDAKFLALIRTIIASFETAPHKGLPLGNVTSQIFANIYLNELDQFVKHQLKAQYYIRYCDDFVILNENKSTLEILIECICIFLRTHLLLELHPNKVTIRKLRQGTDFLGYVSLPHYRVLRTRTKRRMLRKVNEKNLPSYVGLLTHCKGKKLIDKIKLKTDNHTSRCSRKESVLPCLVRASETVGTQCGFKYPAERSNSKS